VRFTFDDLEKNRRGELTMRIFNGTGRVVEFANMSGQIKFNAPNNADPARKGALPTPTLRHDVLKHCYPFQEWFLILEQRVPAQEADKLLAMLRDNVPIHFELAGLNISISPQNDPGKMERMPLWFGMSYAKGSGYGRIISVSAHITGGSKVRVA
jgi:hypothetical protein